MNGPVQLVVPRRRSPLTLRPLVPPPRSTRAPHLPEQAVFQLHPQAHQPSTPAALTYRLFPPCHLQPAASSSRRLSSRKPAPRRQCRFPSTLQLSTLAPLLQPEPLRHRAALPGQHHLPTPMLPPRKARTPPALPLPLVEPMAVGRPARAPPSIPAVRLPTSLSQSCWLVLWLRLRSSSRLFSDSGIYS